jgi:hypothetical protein
MATRPGGESPSEYGLTITAEAPAGTDSVTTVEVGDVFKLSRSTSYKLVAAANSDALSAEVLVQALERSVDVKPISVMVLGHYNRIQRLAYSGTTPTIGQSLQSDGARKVKAVAFDGKTFVCFVDTTKLEVEALI